MTASLFRWAGHQLRKIVLPLVGFWEVSGRLDEVRERIGGLEAAGSAVLALLTDVQQQIRQVDAALTTCDEKCVQIEARTARLESDLAERFDKLAGTLATETDRLDGYIAYRADTLRESIVTLRDKIDSTKKLN